VNFKDYVKAKGEKKVAKILFKWLKAGKSPKQIAKLYNAKEEEVLRILKKYYSFLFR